MTFLRSVKQFKVHAIFSILNIYIENLKENTHSRHNDFAFSPYKNHADDLNEKKKKIFKIFIPFSVYAFMISFNRECKELKKKDWKNIQL
jgi:hypothetical protein